MKNSLTHLSHGHWVEVIHTFSPLHLMLCVMWKISATENFTIDFKFLSYNKVLVYCGICWFNEKLMKWNLPSTSFKLENLASVLLVHLFVKTYTEMPTSKLIAPWEQAYLGLLCLVTIMKHRSAEGTLKFRYRRSHYSSGWGVRIFTTNLVCHLAANAVCYQTADVMTVIYTLHINHMKYNAWAASREKDSCKVQKEKA